MKNANETKTTILGDPSTNVLTNHLNSFLDSDLEALMEDYTDESVLITQEATYKGLKEIETFFTGLMMHFPRHSSSFDLEKMVILGSLGFITWHAKTPSLEVSLGTDTFIIKAGKIQQQTFAGLIKFID